MLRRRIIAALLTAAVVMSTLVFSAAAENETCRVSVTVIGSGTVTVNGTESDDLFTGNFAPGTEVEMIAEPDSEDYDFLYWVNRVTGSGNNGTTRIVSWDPEYTFTVSSFVRYEAVFARSESYLAAQSPAKHTVIYLSSGDNIVYFNEQVPVEDTTYYSQVDTSRMLVSGKTFNGWDKTVDEVAADTGRVIVHPLYETDASFTVTTIINGVTNEAPSVRYLEQYTVSAPATLNDEDFSCWIAKAQGVNAEDEIASFYADYKFVVTGDVVLEAVYGDSYLEDLSEDAQMMADLGISARIAGDFPSRDAHSITIFAEHSVTNDYTVLSHGMLLTKDMSIGSFDETFRIDQIDPNAANPTIVKLTSKDKYKSGSYRITVNNWDPTEVNGYVFYPRIFSRAYVIVKDGNGNTYTIYSPIFCSDYVYDTGAGGGTNYDDPFG